MMVATWKPLRSHIRHISSHDLSDSHDGAGFANLFSRPTPPVNRNMNSVWSIQFLALGGGGGEGGGREVWYRHSYRYMYSVCVCVCVCVDNM